MELAWGVFSFLSFLFCPREEKKGEGRIEGGEKMKGEHVLTHQTMRLGSFQLPERPVALLRPRVIAMTPVIFRC